MTDAASLLPASLRRAGLGFGQRASRLALAAALGLALAGPAGAQDALTEPAPGLGGAATATPTTPRAPEAPVEQEPAPAREQAGMDGQTDLPATSIIRELAPRADESFSGTFRVDAPTGPVLVDVTYSVDLTIFFGYDSDRLLPEALPQVDALGEALRAPELLPHAFLIAGHTDAVGSAGYNLDLSYRRALAVADYLVAYHAIDPARLVPHGWGEAYLKLPSDPGSGANRRVEVSLILPEEGALHLRPMPRYQAHVLPASHRVEAWPRHLFDHHLFDLRLFDDRLVDPRRRLASDALDDFHSVPTRLGH